jgi:hypothetical protein
MPETQVKAIVIANVKLLMHTRYGKVNITAFGRDTGIKTGGAQRVMDPQTNVGVDLLTQIAKEFGIEVWQLLVPNLGQSMLLSPAEVEAIRRIREPLQPKPIDVTATPAASAQAAPAEPAVQRGTEYPNTIAAPTRAAARKIAR